MEGEFSEVKRRTNNKLTDEKMKKQLPIVRSPADGQDDSSTKENAVNKNAKPSVNSNKQATANPNQIVACKAQSQEKTKYFGIDFMEAPLPKINPWTRNQGASSDLENGAEFEITCSKNTNAAELSEGSPKNRGDECSESNCHVDCDGKTDTSPTKGRACQRNAIQPETRTVPAHNSYQAHNPAYKTSNKPKNWDKKHKEPKQNTDLNDSAQWPSLDIVTTDKNKQEQPSARPKLPSQKADESNESDAESQAKPDSPTGDIIENVNTQQANKKKNKQKWVQLPIEMKTERRRGGSNGSRGRGSSRPQYFNEDQARRNNRPTFRKPNKTRDGSRQGQPDDVEARVLDENERNQCIFIGVQSASINRNMGYRGRRGRGRGGYTRGPRDSTNHVIEESLPIQPFFAPVFVADEVDIPIEVQSEGSIVAEVQQSERKESKIKLQIEYYFSEKNLQKDAYLRHMMDGVGWVDMEVICAFPRVKTLGVNRDDVARAMVRSDIVEMAEDGQKLRAKVEPAKWPLKPGVEIEDAHIPRWKALSSNSKLKADAPVFVPGKQYINTNCMNTSQSSNMGSNHYCMDSMNPGQNERN